jgi:CubicO group peptidase (beta-lactamase class C family)
MSPSFSSRRLTQPATARRPPATVDTRNALRPRVTAALALLAVAGTGTLPGQPAAAPTTLDGVWGFSQQLPPAAAGAVTLTRRGAEWRMELGDAVVDGIAIGDTIRLPLPGARGALRVHVGGEPSAFWVQPPGIGPAYATPVTLRRVDNRSWRGTIDPVEQRFSLYLVVRPDSSGVRTAVFRNPEANFGGGRRYRLERDGGAIVLIDQRTGRRRFTQAYDSIARTISFDFGMPLLARPLTRAQATGLYARPASDPPYRYGGAPPGGDGWPVARAAAVGVREAMLDSLMHALINADPTDAESPRVHAVLMARRGRLVLDEYFRGYDAHALHDLRSASKTMTSILLGAAMQAGAAIGPETVATPGGATIGQLLTHTSGLDCNDDDERSPGNEDVMQSQTTERDWYRYTLALAQRQPPGSVYAYCSAGINLVGREIARATGEWLPNAFDRLVARPLGITRYGINLMPTGDAYAGGGMHLRPRDLLKLGQLYLDGGRWRGRRVVSAEWVAQSTSRQQPVPGGADDGYAWHRHLLTVAGRSIPSYEASGNGGQFLLVVPSLELVIVLTAEHYGEGARWMALRERVIARYLVAAALPAERR